MADIFEITGRIHSTSQEHVTTVADEILDETKGKKQSQINAETDATLAEHTSTINGLNSQNYVTVTATDQTTAVTDVLPATGEVATVYRVGNWDGSQYDVTCYSEYSWNGTQYKHLSTKTQIGEVFDISAYHATGGTLATYADLAAALDSNNGGGVPQSLQKGGMSIKFVHAYDNKYVQYRLTKNVWSLDIANWQGVDDEVVESSPNLITSGGGWNIQNKTKYLFSPIWRDDRRLFFDEIDSTIKIIGKKTATDNKLVSFYYEGIRYDITDTISSKQLSFTVIANAGLFVPKSNSYVIYSLDDIVKFEDNNDHDGYIKICHIIYAKEFCGDLILNTQNVSSFNIFDGNILSILKDGVYKYFANINTFVLLLVSNNGTTQQRIWADGNNHIQVRTYSNNTWSAWKDYDTDINQNIEQLNKKTSDLNLNIEILNPDFNYSSVVRLNKSIKSDGVEENFNGRDTFYYKLPNKGETPEIKGCAITAYQWYSGYPDYINGSNSLGRSSIAPAEALYGGVTIDASYSYSNITVHSPQYNYEQTKKDINLYGSNLNNSIGESCFANGVRNDLKILGYGNSFMRNTVHYLSAIAKGCGVNLVVGNLYTGGTNLDDHYAALLNGTNPYEWHKYVDGTNTVNEVNQTALRGLLDERWDAIILHQYTPWSEPFEPIFNQFIKLIIEKIGYCPKIYINATWAGHENYVEQQYGFETEETMWEYMLNACKGACADSGVAEFSIIPTGTAIQNARTLSWADDYNRFVNGGTDWHHLNPAGGFIAACTVFQKIITTLNGTPCSNTTFRITSSTSLPPQTTIEQGILVTDDNYLPMCRAAIAAVNNPNVITTIIESE